MTNRAEQPSAFTQTGDEFTQILPDFPINVEEFSPNQATAVDMNFEELFATASHGQTSIDGDEISVQQLLSYDYRALSDFDTQFDHSQYQTQSSLEQRQADSDLHLPGAPRSLLTELISTDGVTQATTVQQQSHSTSVSKTVRATKQQPICDDRFDHVISGCYPYSANTEVLNNYSHSQQLLECDNGPIMKKIQIKCQPRSKFRPRTENESRGSSHYIRCENGVKPEYPTINLPDAWRIQSNVNIIEVALMGVDGEPHAYGIDNKYSAETYEETALIFKQSERHLLYFRLTDEDFRIRQKSFMIEFVKSRQCEVITKELIRTRQLEHSMLRFTRIYQTEKGLFQRDDSSEVYSSIMTEDYGEVQIEHLGPQFGPMNSRQRIYLIVKGLAKKNDFSIEVEVNESNNGWKQKIHDFVKNGPVIYLLMPLCPFPNNSRVLANLIIYHKDEEIHRCSFLYSRTVDQELTELHLQHSNSNPTAVSNAFNLSNGLSAIDADRNVNGRRQSRPTNRKRLNAKEPLQTSRKH